METEIDYETLRSEVIDLLDRHKTMVLATSASDRVTARSMSCVHKDLEIFFQTDKNFLKYKQMTQNPNVAFCADNMQIEGTAKVKGHPLDEDNNEFRELFKKEHPGSFEKYSNMKDEIVIEVEPKLVILWKYEGSQPLRDFLYVLNRKAKREYYNIVER